MHESLDHPDLSATRNRAELPHRQANSLDHPDLSATRNLLGGAGEGVLSLDHPDLSARESRTDPSEPILQFRHLRSGWPVNGSLCPPPNRVRARIDEKSFQTIGPQRHKLTPILIGFEITFDSF